MLPLWMSPTRDFRPEGRKGKMGKGPLPHELLRRHADQLGISEDVLEQVEAIVSEVKDSQRTLRRDIKSSKLMFTMRWNKTIQIAKR